MGLSRAEGSLVPMGLTDWFVAESPPDPGAMVCLRTTRPADVSIVEGLCWAQLFQHGRRAVTGLHHAGLCVNMHPCVARGTTRRVLPSPMSGASILVRHMHLADRS